MLIYERRQQWWIHLDLWSGFQSVWKWQRQICHQFLEWHKWRRKNCRKIETSLYTGSWRRVTTVALGRNDHRNLDFALCTGFACLGVIIRIITCLSSLTADLTLIWLPLVRTYEWSRMPNCVSLTPLSPSGMFWWRQIILSLWQSLLWKFCNLVKS